MQNHWLFWGFWVCVNALSSFGWGSIVVGSSLVALMGMLVGIAVFIVFYGLVDAYLLKQGYSRIHNALRRSVYIKAGLQLLNAFIFFGWPVSPELWSGIVAVGITDQRLGISQTHQPFWFALLNTLLTGALLSLLVALLTFIIFLLNRIRNNSKLPNSNLTT